VAEQSHWYRVAGGKLCEHWATRDDLTAMLQMGVIHPPWTATSGLSCESSGRGGIAGRTYGTNVSNDVSETKARLFGGIVVGR
jgi:hypothetical protein